MLLGAWAFLFVGYLGMPLNFNRAWREDCQLRFPVPCSPGWFGHWMGLQKGRAVTKTTHPPTEPIAGGGGQEPYRIYLQTLKTSEDHPLA